MYKRLFDVHGTDENRKYAVEELQKGNFDVFHPTYYEPYFLDYLGSKPFVLSVHDFTHEIYPEFFDVPAIIPQRKKLLIERASKVVAISENTKKDIIKYYGTDPRKIEVIHLSSDLSVDNAGEIQNVPEKYILFVGNRSIYKNFYCFVRVAASLMNEDPHLHLVCCGGGKHSPEEELLFEALRINGRVHYFGASNSNLVNLYKRAAVFVFPSLYEGFGIPVLEAFSCNCPVACSSTSSLPEVALDAAEYFNPKDFESMKESIKRVIYDKELRTRLAELGAKRFKDFSVDKTATQMLQVYKSVI